MQAQARRIILASRQGGRNNALFRASALLADHVKAGALTRDDALACLVSASAEVADPLPPTEVLATATHALDRYGDPSRVARLVPPPAPPLDLAQMGRVAPVPGGDPAPVWVASWARIQTQAIAPDETAIMPWEAIADCAASPRDWPGSKAACAAWSSWRWDQDGCTGLYGAMWLDFDSAFDPSDVALRLPGVALVWHTSPSHTLDVPKGRVIIPISRDITSREEYRALATWLGQRLPNVDVEALMSWGRRYYRPTRTPDYAWGAVDGEQLDVDGTLDALALACTPPPEAQRPCISTDLRYDLLIGALAAHLACEGRTYHRAGRVVQVRDGKVADVDVPALRVALARVVDLSDGEGRVRPCTVAEAASVASAGVPSVCPQLDGVATWPPVRPDGTCATAAGYDAVTRVYAVSAAPGVPCDTLEDARLAVERLAQLVGTLPWASAVDRAAWLALVLTLRARDFVDGPTPLFCITANVRGTGKSIGTRAAIIAGTGVDEPAYAWPDDAGEQRKLLDASILAGSPVLWLDNVTASLGGGALDAALTSTTWGARRLGASEVVQARCRTVVVATGNNATLSGDTGRRTVQIRLVSRTSRPERQTFDAPPLDVAARAAGAATGAWAHAVVQAWCRAGRPSTTRPRGSYAAWQGVRDAVTWCTGVDPWPEADDDDDASAHDAWVDLLGDVVHGAAGASEIAQTLTQLLAGEHAVRAGGLDRVRGRWTPAATRDVLGAVGIEARRDEIGSLQVGKALSRALGRPTASGVCVVRERDAHTKRWIWGVGDGQ